MTPTESFHGTFHPLPFLAGLAVLAGWIVAIAWQRRVASRNAFWFGLLAIRFGLAWAFWGILLRIVSDAIETVGTWPRWFLALSAAAASEIVWQGSGTSTREFAPTLRERFADRVMPLLRVTTIGLLAVLLLEPIITHHDERVEERIVAVLLDESDSMTLASRSASDGGLSRRDVAERLLSGDGISTNGLLSRLARDYQLRFYRFGATARATDPRQWIDRRVDAIRPASGTERWSTTTEIANALQQIDGDLSRDALSRVILLTDGCDHSRIDPLQASHRLIQDRIPIHSVVIGSQTPIHDAEVVMAQAPSSLFLGDSVAVKATLKIDQYSGQTAIVRLLKDGQPIEEKRIPVTSDRFRESVHFQPRPDDVGVHRYTVQIDPMPDEANRNNNAVDQYVTVSKDHVHLLVVDERPRWEYRYLRNLFSGRDRTVHLQSVLLQPDRLAGVPAPPTMRASALRAFDDCDANALPATVEEWLKFDAIVLGDVSPEQLGTEGMRALEIFVKNRGGSLIVISGRNHMPHRFVNTPLADLFPVKLPRTVDPEAVSPDVSFFFSPTRDPSAHLLLQHIGEGMESLAHSFPSLSWRHPACEAKAGATVLGYASPEKPNPLTPATLTDEQQRRQALMLWQRFGAGKVLQLTFDQTWRLRLGVGDPYHHQFWGQLIRWAVRDRLPVGTDFVRMGTDRVIYRPGDNVHLRVQLMDAMRNAVKAEIVSARVFDGDTLVQTVPLLAPADPGSEWHAEIHNLKPAGKYRIVLSGESIDQLLALEKKEGTRVSTEIVVQSASESSESTDVVADATVPTQLANASGGIVVTPDRVEELYPFMGPKSTSHRERWTVPLWNRWPVLVIVLTGINLEWLLRRFRGLI